MGLRRLRYNDDPDVKDVPLSVEEAAWVAEHPGTVRGKAAVAHLASRAAATANQLRQARLNFDDELRRRTSHVPTRQVQSTLSPEAAARFLSPEQLAGLFDKFSQEKLAALESQRQTAVNAQQAALQVLTWVASHPDTPADLRQQAQAYLHAQETR